MFLGESFVHIQAPSDSDDGTPDIFALTIAQRRTSSSRPNSRRRNSLDEDLLDGAHESASCDSSDSYDVESCDVCHASSATGMPGRHSFTHERLQKQHYKSMPNLVEKIDAGYSLPNVNLEDFKDVAHKMEDFDKTSERKWVLQYDYFDRKDKFRLSKIIVGRGQNNDYPELNSVLLFGETAEFSKATWRHTAFNALRQRNAVQTKCFSLLPSPMSCYNCFKLCSSLAVKHVATGKPLVRSTSIDARVQLDSGNDVSQMPVSKPVPWQSNILTDLRMRNFRSDQAALRYQRARHELRLKKKSKFSLRFSWRKRKGKTVVSDAPDGWEPYDVISVA